MEITIQSQEISKVQIPFTVNEGKWTYQDILEFESNCVPNEEELKQIIQDKFTAWKSYVETPKQ